MFIRKAAIAFFALTTIVILSACGSGHPLVGKWVNENHNDIFYQFKSNGTVIISDGERKTEDTWEAVGDNQIMLENEEWGRQYFRFEIDGKTAYFYDGIYGVNGQNFKKA